MPPSDRPETPAAIFGAMLKHCRERAGLSQIRLAQVINFSDSHVASVETGRRNPKDDFVRLCDDATDSNGVLVKLYEMFLGHKGFMPGFEEWSEIERVAAIIRGWESRLIPGLLQTDDYMAAVLHLDGPEAIDARKTRQAVFARKEPPVVRYVLDEYVLRHPVGDSDIMDSQLAHLEQVVDSGLANVQVVPPGALPGIGGAFALATVNGRPVGYEESTTQVKVLTGDRDLHQLEVVYDRLLAEADAPGRSVDRIRRVRTELWKS